MPDLSIISARFLLHTQKRVIDGGGQWPPKMTNISLFDTKSNSQIYYHLKEANFVSKVFIEVSGKVWNLEHWKLG